MNIGVSITQCRKKNLTFGFEPLVLLPSSTTLHSSPEETTNRHIVVLSKLRIKTSTKITITYARDFFASLNDLTKYVCIPKKC